MASDDLGLARIPVQAAEGKPLRHLAWADMPSYGKLDFLQLREAVSEAIFGDRHHLGGFQASHYAGHQKVEGINYNSLNRIVTAFVSAALSAEGGAGAAVAQKQAAEDKARLDWLEANSNVDIAYEGWEEDVWQVHTVNGGRSNREWTLRGEGVTVRQAIDTAIETLRLRAEDQQKAAATPTIADPDGEVDVRAALTSQEVVRYVAEYGGHCRECADHNGCCQDKGLPCNWQHRQRVIRHVLDALGYGLQHGFLPTVTAALEGRADA